MLKDSLTTWIQQVCHGFFYKCFSFTNGRYVASRLSCSISCPKLPPCITKEFSCSSDNAWVCSLIVGQLATCQIGSHWFVKSDVPDARLCSLLLASGAVPWSTMMRFPACTMPVLSTNSTLQLSFPYPFSADDTSWKAGFSLYMEACDKVIAAWLWK